MAVEIEGQVGEFCYECGKPNDWKHDHFCKHPDKLDEDWRCRRECIRDGVKCEWLEKNAHEFVPCVPQSQYGAVVAEVCELRKENEKLRRIRTDEISYEMTKLRDEAEATYEAAEAIAMKKLDKAREPTWKAYEAADEAARKVFHEDCAPALEAYRETMAKIDAMEAQRRKELVGK